jgi:hypothetical protein
VVWPPLRLAVPLLVAATGAPLIHAFQGAARAAFPGRPHMRWSTGRLRGLTLLLHIVQPLARMLGRVREGLHPARRLAAGRACLPFPRTVSVWNQHWRASDDMLRSFEETLRATGCTVLQGGVFDGWDLEVKGGLLGGVRTLLAVEEHGEGRQMLRLRLWPRLSRTGMALILLLGGLTVPAVLDHAWIAAVTLGGSALVLAGRMLRECGIPLAALAAAARRIGTGAA